MKRKSLMLTTLAVLSVLSACTPSSLVYEQAKSFYDGGNYDQAFPLYQEAAQSGVVEAQLALAKCYDFGRGVKSNPAEAVRWYTAAANSGNADAQDNLATCYLEGYGVPKNLEQAFYWYKQAADQGNPFALNNLGLCYRNGEGTEVNHEMATQCFLKAAQMGNANAQYNLGRSYYHGLGVPLDMQQAREWISRAAAQGHQNAAAFMKDNDWQYVVASLLLIQPRLRARLFSPLILLTINGYQTTRTQDAVGVILEPECDSVNELSQRKGSTVYADCTGNMDDEGTAISAFRADCVAVCVVFSAGGVAG